MLIISAGLQKSGSAYIYNIINDMVDDSIGLDARKLKEEHNLDDVLKWHNNNIGELRFKTLWNLISLSKRFGSFVVKTHEASTLSHRLLQKLGLIKTILIYRDLRDVLVSAQDHGRKIVAGGEHHTFAKIIEFDKALVSVRKWAETYYSYRNNQATLLVKYEDLINEPMKQLARINDYLNTNVSVEKQQEILNKYDFSRKDADLKGMHFNKAKIGRFREVLAEAEIIRMNQDLSKVLQDMGYSL